MKINIRKNVFETNSSSTHSICISKTNIKNLKLPKKLLIKTGEFGWEENVLHSSNEKASYLYTAVCEFATYMTQKEGRKYLSNFENFIYQMCCKYGIEVTFEHPEFESDHYLKCDGYIDHVEELKEFVNKIYNNEKRLMRFLFDSNSFILTSNDNNGRDVTINVNYEHEEYYKEN